MYSNKKGEVTNVSVRRVSHIPHGLKCSLLPHLPALNFHVRAFLGFFTEEGDACSLKDKSTFTHKVQVSANRTATGAVLPIGLTDQNALLQFRDSTFRSFHVPSDRPFLVESTFLSVRTLRFLCSHHFQQTACGTVASCPFFAFLETQTLFPPEWKCQPASADVLLTGLCVQED